MHRGKARNLLKQTESKALIWNKRTIGIPWNNGPGKEHWVITQKPVSKGRRAESIGGNDTSYWEKKCKNQH